MPIGVVMLVKCKQKLDDKELNSLRADFKNEMNLKDEDFYYEGALKRTTKEDHQFISVENNEFTWLEVNFYNSYYQIGYERGDINLYVRCAEWIEKRIPDCEVYYGHDVDDDSIILFDAATRVKLLNHHRKFIQQKS